MSSVAIRAGDLLGDRDLLVDALSQYLTPLADRARYDWLYLDSPHGRAKVWIATDADKGQVIGVAATFPRRFYVDQRVETAWVLGDFCLSPQYRSLGPALQLQRACLAGVAADDAAFWYDFPNSRMLAVYKRLEIRPVGNLMRFAKPLQVDRRVEALVGNAFVARQLSSIGNLALRLIDTHKKVPGDFICTLEEGLCGPEFSELARKMAGRYAVFLNRTAEYLNWRYFRNPFAQYELLAARSDGELRGYLFLCCSPDGMTVADVLAAETWILKGLLQAAVGIARERAVSTLSIPLFEFHPQAGVVERLGFKKREACPVFLQFSSHSRTTSSEVASNWFLTIGDRDS